MRGTRVLLGWLIVVLLLVVAGGSATAHAATSRGKVTAVVDGDTLKAKVGRKTKRFDLAGVDAPELRGGAAETCYGTQARSRLRRLLARNTRIVIRTRGRSRRAEVLRGRTNVNRAVVRGGFARALAGGGRLGRLLRRDEAAARRARRGLWAACTETPGGSPAPPGGAQPGDVTGQAAIDQLTAELRDGRLRKFRTQDNISDAFELDLCGDGRFRFSQTTTAVGTGVFVTEWHGNPWQVIEALVRADGSYRGARVAGTFTEKRRFSDGQSSPPEPVSEPAEVRIEEQNGTLYWDGEPAEYLAGAANCNPTI